MTEGAAVSGPAFGLGTAVGGASSPSAADVSRGLSISSAAAGGAAAPTGAPTDARVCAHCETAPRVTYSTQVIGQVGPVIGGYAVQDDGSRHLILGGGTPGVGVVAMACRTTGDGGIDGWAGGVQGGVPGLGPAASYATDGTNATVCVGAGAGEVNGAAYTVTVPVPSLFGPTGNPGDTYVPASMNPDGTIAPARFVPGPPPPPPAPVAPSTTLPPGASTWGGRPGDTYVPAHLNGDGSITPAHSIPARR